MGIDDKKVTRAESLRETRTYGKVRCHNPSCMGRMQPKPGDKTVKCPECGLEFRVAWIKPDFPRIRGPVWEENKKLAQEAAGKRGESK
jgi:tRNA(Ile2) C34 agmatinyltransferase TiaS